MSNNLEIITMSQDLAALERRVRQIRESVEMTADENGDALALHMIDSGSVHGAIAQAVEVFLNKTRKDA